jgi:hypothetical protein
MITHRTHCSLRLGDNLLALHLLRGLAKANPGRHFIHYAHVQYIPQLAEVVCDLPNLQVCDLESVAESLELRDQGSYWRMAPRPLLGSVDLWKNAGGFWESHPLRNDYAQFALAYGVWVCARLSTLNAQLSTPWRCAADLLFDYPALSLGKAKPFDVLVVNSAPQSGQMPRYNPQELTALVAELARQYVVVTTAPTGLPGVGCTLHQGMTVTGVGVLSRFCRVIVAVSTGPSWCTFNVWNQESVEFRLMLIGNEDLSGLARPERYAQAATVSDARRLLQLRGIL